MCGLWGYAGQRRGGAAPVLLERIISLASHRGPDGYGVWSDGRVERGYGRVDLDDVDFGAAVIVGHARLATMLGSTTPENNQPICRGDVVLTHNGTIWNYHSISRFFRVSTKCDSELLAIAMDDEIGTLERRFENAREKVALGTRFAIVALLDSEVLICAERQSLYVLEGGGSVYWCSVKPDNQWERIEGCRSKRYL
jgi:glutamine phosphoribosylpyrophosphate amidotransferase